MGLNKWSLRLSATKDGYQPHIKEISLDTTSTHSGGASLKAYRIEYAQDDRKKKNYMK